MKVPYLDLQAQYRSIKSEVDQAIAKVLDNSAYVLGPSVASFENDFATYCQSSHSIGVNNGTNALLLALRAMGVGPGDEVITAANTFIATVAAIAHSGAKPVLVDVDPVSRNIDPQLIKMSMSRKTKVLLPVHLYGRMADMDLILKLCDGHDLLLLEDAAQAQGAEYKGRRAGSLGAMGAFSFYPGKNLGAFGEAGGITTSDEKLAEKAKMLRDHGSSRKYYHDLLGYNARMEGIQGAVLGVKLKHLDKWNKARNQVADWYDEGLKGLPVTLPSRHENYAQVFHVYVIETDCRDQLQAYLKEKDIPTIIHYPIPIHLQKAFSYLDYKQGEFPIAEKLSNGILSLPIFPEMTHEMVQEVSSQIRQFFNAR